MFEIGSNAMILYKGYYIAVKILDIKDNDESIINYTVESLGTNKQKFSVVYDRQRQKWENYKWED